MCSSVRSEAKILVSALPNLVHRQTPLQPQHHTNHQPATILYRLPRHANNTTRSSVEAIQSSTSPFRLPQRRVQPHIILSELQASRCAPTIRCMRAPPATTQSNLTITQSRYTLNIPFIRVPLSLAFHYHRHRSTHFTLHWHFNFAAGPHRTTSSPNHRTAQHLRCSIIATHTIFSHSHYQHGDRSLQHHVALLQLQRALHHPHRAHRRSATRSLPQSDG